MADDKRAEAMKRAIAESDAQRGGGKDSGGSDKTAEMKKAVGKGADAAKEKIGELWNTKLGKVGLLAVVGVVALIILVSVISGVTGKVQDAPISYSLSNSIICVYENPDVPSGYSYDAYVEITNTGTSNIYAKDMSFLIGDDDGNRIMIDNNLSFFPAILRPNEKGYIFNRFGTELTGIYDKEMNLRLVPTFTIMRTDAEPHSYPVQNVTVSQGPNGQKMVGQVTNDTSKTVQSMYVIGVTYDSQGHCTGISGTFLKNIEPHVTVNVQFDPMNMIRAWRNSQVVDYAIKAY